MSASSKGQGADYLVEKSDLARTSKARLLFKDIVVLEDEQLDGNRMLATLRTMLGYEISIRRAQTLNGGIDLLLAQRPDLVLLDDYMGPVDRATDAMPLIRRAGYGGPVVVISGGLTRARHNELMQIGVAAALNKDDLDSGSIGRIMSRVADEIEREGDITSPVKN